MTIRLTLVCHAATAATREAAYPADEPLDAQGLAKALSAAGLIRRVDTAWTSPALRALQTAAALGLAATIDPALRDIDLGRWAGRSLSDVHSADPAALETWATDPNAAPHGGESIVSLVGRVSQWLDTITAGSVVAVTHPAVIRAAVIAALDADPLSFWRIDVAPLGTATLHGRAGGWALRSLSLGRPETSEP